VVPARAGLFPIRISKSNPVGLAVFAIQPVHIFLCNFFPPRKINDQYGFHVPTLSPGGNRAASRLYARQSHSHPIRQSNLEFADGETASR